MSRLLSIGLMGLILVTGAMGQERRASQQPAIILGRSLLVSSDDPTSPHVESFIALSPKDPAQMLVTSIVFPGSWNAAVYASLDGGRTWRRSTSVGAGIRPPHGADPIVYFDTTGTAFFGALDPGYHLWRSADSGLHWNSVVMVPPGKYDRQYLAVDTTSGRFAGRLYTGGVVGSVQKVDGRGLPLNMYRVIGVAYSTDHGATFAPPVLIDSTSVVQQQPAVMADLLVTRGGTLIVPFDGVSLDAGKEGGSLRQFWTTISNDGGETFSIPRPGPRPTYGSGFRYAKTFVAPRATIDLSDGPFADRIYLLWVNFAQNRYDIKVAYSDDLGLTWSTPVTVNDNRGPNDPGNPAFAVNRDGIVAVIWNDRRDDPRNECYRLYASASLDGGDTWLPNVRINPNPTCSNALGNWPGQIASYLGRPPKGTSPHRIIRMFGAPESWPNGGDTQGLVAGPDGRFHAAWINGESGVMQIWYTDFTVQRGAQTVGPRRVNRTEDISVEVSEPVTDFAAKSLSFTVSLKNESSDFIPGPLTLVLDQLEASLTDLRAANADNGRPLRGAAWVFSLDGRRGLGPGEVSESRVLRWQFDGQIPSEPYSNRLVGNFRVFSDGIPTQEQLRK